MKMEGIRGKIPAVTIVVCSLWIGTFSFTLDAVADEATMYELTVTVVSEHGTVEPNSGYYSAGTVVTLTATPEPDYLLRHWTGTDDDTSCALTNTVTMDSDKTVTVEFGQRHVFFVVGGEPNLGSIQYAIDAAGCGDVIILNAGVYFEDINFNGKDIRVTSTNPDDPDLVAYTIIQGTGTGPVVTFSGSESQSCALDGLTITGGNTTGDGGGICGNGTEATISNCVITNNHADGVGGGVSNCSGTIVRCTITDNTAGGGGGGIYVVDCNVTVEDCDINYNAAADGGGLYCIDSPGVTITRCTISDNDANGSGMDRGGGIFVLNSPILIEDCRISRNNAMYSGGGVFLAGQVHAIGDVPQVRQCLITENTAGIDGGGISCVWQVETIISNCTIADNTVADGYGGGLYCSYDSYVEVINSIIWGNFAEQGLQVAVCSGDEYLTLPSILTISYSDVEGGQGGAYVGVGSTLDWGIGTIDSDPQLVDPKGGDWHLGAGSPCIDAGDNTAVPPSVLTDLDGNPRIANYVVDMGAYEFQGPFKRYYHVDGVNGDNTNDGLTKETAFKTIQRGINVAEDYETVLVWPGVYNEEVAFWGDAITVRSAADAAIVETDYGYAFSFFSAEGPDTILSNFVIRNSQYGIYLINGASPTLSNLTIVDNDFGISAFNGADPDISSCIFWNNFYGDLFRDPVPLEAKYSFVQDDMNEPVAHWKFDDGSGSTATDSAGTNNGTLIGDPTWTAGRIGGALSFDGDGDYVEFASVAALEGDNLTAQAWVCVDESAGVWNPVIMQHDLNSNGYSFYIVNNRPSFYIVNSAVFVQVISTEAINADQWYHVAGTNDGSNLKLYVDGQLKDSEASTGFTGVNYNAYIGFEPTSMLYYKGLIDDVRIYDRALSAGDIKAIYEGNLAGISYGEPGFVDVNSGDYHLLSERGRYWPAHDVWVLDDVTSPCIDGGDPAVDPSNERTPNGGRINMGAYGNSAYASMSECWSKSDFNCDGIVNFRDFAVFAQDWLNTALVVPDTIPPAPVPAIITIGAVSSSSIMMTASEAFDESGVEYYFEALSAGGHDSGWIGARTYTDAGLIPDTTYCYRVKARDKSANYNETIWSPQVCAVTVVLPDTLAPLPDPMQWDDQVDANGYNGLPREILMPPYGAFDYGATMRAIDADDQAPPGVAPAEVEYYFECQDDNGFDSGWRTVAAYPNELERRTYTVKLGPAGQALRFRVMVRDSSDNHNMTLPSDWHPTTASP